MVSLGDKYSPPVKLSDLSTEQRECFNVLQKTLVDNHLTSSDILTIFAQSNFTLGESIKLADRLCTARSHFQAELTVLDLAPFCSLNGSGGPDACQYLLENEKGECARDIHGRPVSICRGMFYGTFREDISMVKYTLQRASQYYKKGCAKSLLLIFDLSIYQGCAQTFRVPDSVYLELVKYQKKYCLELMGTVSNVAVVGLPKMFAVILDMMRRGFGYGCTWSFHTSYEALIESGIITRDNLPPQHGGTFAFDLEGYVKWRAKEEELEQELELIEPRRFNDEGLLPLYSGAAGASYLVRFPPSQALVDSYQRTDADTTLFLAPLSVNGKPSIVVLTPWNELRVHPGSNTKQLGKVKMSLIIDNATKVDSFTDFVFESEGPLVDKKNVSARYSVVIQSDQCPQLVFEASPSAQNSLRELVRKLTWQLEIYDNTVSNSEGITELTGDSLTECSEHANWPQSSEAPSAKKGPYGGGVDSSSDPSPPAKSGEVSWSSVLNFLGSST